MTARMYAMYFLSFALGLVLNLMHFHSLNPDWVALILLYWALHGVHYALFLMSLVLGFSMDCLTNGYLGVHGMLYVFLYYFGYGASRRMRISPLWEKALCVTLLLLLSQGLQGLMAFALYGLMHFEILFKTLLTGLVFWPALHFMLHAIVGADIEDQIKKDIARL